MPPNGYFSSGEAAGLIRSVLSDALTVRIATAYFETGGYSLLAPALAGKRVRILVGRSERGPDRIKDVIREFLASIETYEGSDRLTVLAALRDALREGNFFMGLDTFGDETIVEPKYSPLHAKVYIADRRLAVVSSSNMTYSGLRGSVEAGYVVRDADDVAYFVERFDGIFESAEPIGGELLDLLDQYLHIHDPFLVYARSLLSLYEIEDYEQSGTLPELADYQRPIVSRLVRSMEDYRGAMLVASTGLGKTVIGSHLVAYLRKNGSIDSVLVLCPAGLKSMWRDYLRRARVSGDVFSYYILSIDDWRKYRDIVILEKELESADDKTLVILDESHHLRNSTEGTDLRLRNRRIIDVVGRRAKILLMTATPYSKDVSDINAQLELLPGKRDDESLFDSDDHAIVPWSVEAPSQLSNTQPCTVLTTPSVVKHYSLSDGTGNRYVVFSGNEKRYFPHAIAMRMVPFENPVDRYIIELLESGLLYRDESGLAQESLFSGEIRGRRDPLLEARVVHQGCSSTGEFRRLVGKLGRIDGDGYEKMRFSRQDELSRWAEPVYAKLEEIAGSGDRKIGELEKIVGYHHDKNEKIVVFCHYIETAKYVKGRLSALPGIRVETNADKDPDTVEGIIDRFAPESNLLSRGDGNTEMLDDLDQIDVLVATGALAEGFNFQDASVLVNFDLPWTVLSLAQRMGRILRPWRVPRTISVYTMFPSSMNDPRIMHAQNWKQRLSRQNTEMKSFLDIPAIVERDEKESIIELVSLAKTLSAFGDEVVDLDEVLEFIRNAERIETNSFVDDLASITDDERREILGLPRGIRSVRIVRGLKNETLYILIRKGSRLFPALFSRDGSVLVDHLKVDAIMDRIRCERNTHRGASVLTLEYIDDWVFLSLRKWADRYGFPRNEISADCVMALRPSGE